MASAFGVLQVVVGLMVILVTTGWGGTASPLLALGFVLLGAVLIVSGLRILRSKVTADEEGLRLRGLFGTKCLRWHEVAAFVRDEMWTRTGKLHVVAVVPFEGRVLTPWALGQAWPEQADQVVLLLENMRREHSARESRPRPVESSPPEHSMASGWRPQGWCTDPWGLHDARWFSDGTPTGLVRFGNEEKVEPVPESDWTVQPAPFVPDGNGEQADPNDQPQVGEAAPQVSEWSDPEWRRWAGGWSVAESVSKWLSSVWARKN